MKLDELGARTLSFDDIRALFPGAEWLWVFSTIAEGTPVHFVEGELAVDDFEAGRGPWVLIVHGDLIATGDLDFTTTDYNASLLVVCGSLRARNFVFASGAQCVVLHDLDVAGCVFGRYGDESAFLDVAGLLKAHALLLDHVTGISAGTIDAVVCSSPGWGLPMDLNYEGDSHADVVVPEALDRGCLDIFAAYRHAITGAPLFLPGARERLYGARSHPWRKD